MTTFKPYRYKGCIIYSPKNRQFLEGFAESISKLSKQEKTNIAGNKIVFGGVSYQIALGGRKDHLKILLVSGTKQGGIYLAEE
jgi:hypothetical protein